MRRQKVVFDSDLAKLYGVPVKQLNQAVKRNADRFPEDFCFQLTTDEDENLKSQMRAFVALREVVERLQPLISPPPEEKKPRIGFHRGNR